MNDHEFDKLIAEANAILKTHEIEISMEIYNSFHPSFLVMALGYPVMRITSEDRSWFGESVDDPLEILEFEWGDELDGFQLALHVAIRAIWQLDLSRPSGLDFNAEGSFHKSLTKPTLDLLVARSGNPANPEHQRTTQAIASMLAVIERDLDFGNLFAITTEAKWRLDPCFKHIGPTEPQKFLHTPRVAVVNGITASLNLDYESWRTIRRQSIGASEARFLLKSDGSQSKSAQRILSEKSAGYETPWLEVFERGVEREPLIAADFEERFAHLGLRHNHFLFAGQNNRHVATPDLIGEGVVGEIKVSTKPLASALKIYRDQLQWQMHVTGARAALFVVENRYDEGREYLWVIRDQNRIDLLVSSADDLLSALDRETRRKRLQFDCVEFSKFSEPNAKQMDSEQMYMSKESDDKPAIVLLDTQINELDDGSAVELFDSWEDFDFTDQEAGESAPEPFEWTRKSTRRLLKRYLAGDTIYEMADGLRIEPSVAMGQLANLLLNPKGALVDESAEHFGQTWTEESFETLDRLWKLKVELSEIARTLGRDQLGVAFVIFSRHSPAIPKAVIRDFKLK